MSYSVSRTRALIAAVLLFGILNAHGLAAVVFDNTTNSTGGLNGGRGTELTLAVGPRRITRITIPAMGPGDEPLTFRMSITLYANDGPDEGWGPSPATPIWYSGHVFHTLSPGAVTTLEFSLPTVAVPDSFTLFFNNNSVQGLEPQLPQFYPPSVGSARFGRWYLTLATPSGWAFNDTTAPFGVVIYTANVPAVSTWGIIALGLALATAGTLLIRSRPRASGWCTLVTVTLIASPPVGMGQVTIGDAVRINTGDGAAQNETSVAASRSSASGVVVAAWNDWREGQTENPPWVRIGVGISDDWGETWTDYLLRPPLAYQSENEADPMTAYDPRTGTVWAGGFSFVNGGALFVAAKGPTDDDFQDPPVVPATGLEIDKCLLAVGGAPNSPTSTRLFIAY